MSIPEIGVQLYSLRRELEADFERTLRELPEMGFSAVELARTGERGAEAWRSALDSAGLRVIGAHVRLEELEGEWEKYANFQRVLHNRVLVVPAPQKGWEVAGEADYQETAERLNRLGARAREEGFAFAYHNHHWEFAPFDASPAGLCGMDVLLRETDPQLVSWEFDTAWVKRGGWDPVKLLLDQRDRVLMVHAKEYCAADGSEPPMGEGDVEFRSVVAMAGEYGWPLVVEYEGEPATHGVAHSARYLRSLITSRG